MEAITTLFFTLSSPAQKTILFKSNPLPAAAAAATTTNRLEWGPLENVLLENVSPFNNSNLHTITCHVSLLQGVLVPWFQLQLHFVQLVFSAIVTIKHEMDYGSFTLKTTSTKDHRTSFKVNHVWLDYNPHALEAFIQNEAQIRLVASIQVREWNAAKQMSQHVHYMGRAQLIETKAEGATRTYKWTAKTEETTFHGVHLLGEADWEQQTRDHFIKMRLKLKVPSEEDRMYSSALTTRTRRSSIASNAPDGDAFSNPNCTLPIPIKNGQYFTFKLFNLLLEEEMECPSVEVSMRMDINPRGFVSERVTPNICVIVAYGPGEGDGGSIYLTKVSLIVKNYQSTLLDLGNLKGRPHPLTI